MSDAKTRECNSDTETSEDEEVSSSNSSDDPDFGEDDIKEQLKTEFEELAYFFGWEYVKDVWRSYDKKDDAARSLWQDKVHSRTTPDEGKGSKNSMHSQLEYEFVDLIKSYGFEMVTDVLHEYANGQEQARLSELRRKMDAHEFKQSVMKYLYRQIVDINDEIQKGHDHNRKYLNPVYCPSCDYCGKTLYDNIIVNVMEPEESRGFFHEACFEKACPINVPSDDHTKNCKSGGEILLRHWYVQPQDRYPRDICGWPVEPEQKKQRKK